MKFLIVKNITKIIFFVILIYFNGVNTMNEIQIASIRVKINYKNDSNGVGLNQFSMILLLFSIQIMEV